MSALEKIERWLNALEQFDPWQSCCDFYKQNEGQLVEMNRQQLSNMMTPEGDPITVLGAGEYGKVYDLYNTGAFYGGITITTERLGVINFSDPYYTESIVCVVPAANTELDSAGTVVDMLNVICAK